MMWQWFNGGFGGFWGMWFMPVIGLVFLGLVIWGIVAMARGATHHASHMGCYGMSEHSSDSALEILKGRYARGEINKQEFEEKKKDLI